MTKYFSPVPHMFMLTNAINGPNGTYAGSYTPGYYWTSSTAVGLEYFPLNTSILDWASSYNEVYALGADQNVYLIDGTQVSQVAESIAPSAMWTAIGFDGFNLWLAGPQNGLYSEGTTYIADSIYLLDINGTTFAACSENNWYMGTTHPFGISSSGSFFSNMMPVFIDYTGYACGFSPVAIGENVTFVGRGHEGRVLTLQNSNQIVEYLSYMPVASASSTSTFSSSAVAMAVNTTQYAIADPYNNFLEFVNSPSSTFNIPVSNVGYAVSPDGLSVTIASNDSVLVYTIYNNISWTNVQTFTYNSPVTALSFYENYAFWSENSTLYLYQYNQAGEYSYQWDISVPFSPNYLVMDNQYNIYGFNGTNIFSVSAAGSLNYQTSASIEISQPIYLWSDVFLSPYSSSSYLFSTITSSGVSQFIQNFSYSGSQIISSGGVASYINLGGTSAPLFFDNIGNIVYFTSGSSVAMRIGNDHNSAHSFPSLIPVQAGWISNLGNWTTFLGTSSGIPTSVAVPSSGENFHVMFNNGNILDFNKSVGSYVAPSSASPFPFGSVFSSTNLYPTMIGTFNGMIANPYSNYLPTYPITWQGIPLIFNGITVGLTSPVNFPYSG